MSDATISHSYPTPLEINCQNCKKANKLYTHYRAVAFTCSHCHAHFNINKSGELKHIQNLTVVKSTFKVGTVFTIDKVEYVLTGYLVKSDIRNLAVWTEYTLFNPIEGNRILSESDGHYSLLKITNFYQTDKNLEQVEYPELGQFQLYQKYNAKIKNAEGEFFYTLFDHKTTPCEDYVTPPHILSVERTPENTYWYLGEYCSQSKVSSWLKEKVDLPYQDGVAANQPFLLNFKLKDLYGITGFALVLLFISQMTMTLFNNNSEVLNHNFYQNDSSKVYVTPAFTITQNNCAIDVNFQSDVANGWVEGDFILINETTGDRYYFGQCVEYYYGTSDGESWSEGSSSDKITVGGITAGVYHVNATLTFNNPNPSRTATISIQEDVTLLSNFFYALILIIVFPLLMRFRKRSFDRKQWYNSDYSPYNYGEDDE
jgi:hypothetical protein